MHDRQRKKEKDTERMKKSETRNKKETTQNLNKTNQIEHQSEVKLLKSLITINVEMKSRVKKITTTTKCIQALSL